MNDLITHIKGLDSFSQFSMIPVRIFLDTNVLQYLQDFGEYIFEHFRENKDYFTDSKGRIIDKNNPNYNQIEALEQIFITVNRANWEFALSDSSYNEVSIRGNYYFTSWFYNVLDHWRTVVEEYQGEAFSDDSFHRYNKAVQDKSLLGSFSKKDQKIILDAISYDCRALLTTDKFANDQNKKIYAFQNYNLMILKPTELLKILKPFMGLF